MAGLNLPKKRFFEAQASIFKRGLAYFLDISIIIFIIVDRFTKQLSVLDGLDFNNIIDYVNTNPEMITNIIMIEFIISLLALSYFVIFEYKFERTPGKIFARLFIKDKKNKKQLITLKQALIRSIFKIPFSFFTLLMFIDIIHFIFNRERLGDKLANTKVVEVMVG